MKKKVIISAPYIEITDENKYRLCAVLREDERADYTAWYEVEPEYGAYLCCERSDAFVVALLPYAIRKNLDIQCEQVVSERLHYQLNQILIPTLSKNISEFHPIRIIADVSSEVLPSQHANGASVSGGVDSFYTLLSHLHRKEKNFEISHLAFFNVGASGDCGGAQARLLFHDRVAWVKKIADSLGLPMLCLDSNISEYLGLSHVCSHTYRTLSAVLAVQKLFSGYFFASGYPYERFHFSANDPSTFDLLNLKCLSTENITFYLSGAEKTRLEKLDVIAEYNITHSTLNVCTTSDSNCSYCPKCKRTMMGLYLLDKLDRYESVFKVAWFKSSINAQIADACSLRDESDWKELYSGLKRRHMVRWYHHIWGFMRKCIRKSINKEGLIRRSYLRIRPIIRK